MNKYARLPALLMVFVLLAGALPAFAEVPPMPTIHATGETVRPAAEAVRAAMNTPRDGYFPLRDAVTAWMEHHIALDPAGGYVVTLPDYGSTKRGDIPVYAGQPPADFLPSWAEALLARVEVLPAGETIAVDAQGGSDGLAEAVETSLLMGEIWLTKLMNETKAYQALTRMALDYGGDAVIWKNLSVVEDAQRPRFASEQTRKTLSSTWSGVRVREAQEALAALGYWPEHNISGQYDKAMEEAVATFEADHGLPEDGLLDDSDLRVLYEEPLPWTLPQLAVQGLPNPPEDFAAWWDAYLGCLVDIRWESAALVYLDMSGAVDFEALYDGVTTGYSEGEVPFDTIVQTLATGASAVGTAGNETAAGEVVAQYLDLTALAERDFEGMFTDGGAARVTATGLAFCATMQLTLEEVSHYAEINPAAQPFPKTGAVVRPPSGGARLKFRNDYDFPIYLRIYEAEDEWDDSAETFLGSMFIDANKSATTSLKRGYIHLHYAEGDEHWYGEELMFGDEGSYYCIDENYEMRSDYEITLWMTSPGDSRESDSSSGYSWVGQSGF